MRRPVALIVSFLVGGATTTILGWVGLADLAPRRGEMTQVCASSSWLRIEITTWHPDTTDHPSPTDQVDCETNHARPTTQHIPHSPVR